MCICVCVYVCVCVPSLGYAGMRLFIAYIFVGIVNLLVWTFPSSVSIGLDLWLNV